MTDRLKSQLTSALANYCSAFIPEEWITIDPATRHTVIVLRDDLRDFISAIDLDLLAEYLAEILIRDATSCLNSPQQSHPSSSQS